jgi:alkanesulfonate monooxygenase SsuD/methylene tetrahydromethanopterin reductase-like flavin-dependent oxidoreductase (luciferase family)
VRIGISLSSALTAETPGQVVAMMAGRAAKAYEVGLSSLSVGDHHAERRWYMQNTPTLGRLLAHWPDRPAGCLFLLPLWHPMLVAEQVGTLAAMVDAPFIVQVGIGAGQEQFAAMGADVAARGRTTDEAIAVIQGLLRGDTVASPALGMGPCSLGLRPAQGVEWWIGGHVAATLRRAATLGTAWYGGPNLTIAQSESLIAGYRAACQQAGTAPRAIVRRDVLVLEDGDRARARAAAMVEKGYRGLGLHQLIVGTRNDAAAQLQPLADVGYDDVIVRCMTNDQAEALETIELLGTLAKLN